MLGGVGSRVQTHAGASRGLIHLLTGTNSIGAYFSVSSVNIPIVVLEIQSNFVYFLGTLGDHSVIRSLYL